MRLVRIALTMAIGVGSCLGVSPSAVAGPEQVSFANASKFAHDGLWEPYTWGGQWWFDNDSFRARQGCCYDPASKSTSSSAPREGPDCSSYVSKVWTVPTYSRQNEPNGHPYTTATYWNNESFEGKWQKVRGGFSGLQTLDVMVRRDGDRGHMVLFEARRNDGRIRTLEAHTTDLGVLRGEEKNVSGAAVSRAPNYWKTWRFRERANWPQSNP